MHDPREKQFRRAVEEFGSWEYWMQAIRAEESLPDGARHAALTGITDIQRVLGRGWWRDAVREGHPLLAPLLNGAPWTRYRIGEFGERLRTLQRVAGFKELARRLKDARGCAAALAELDIAYRVVEAGFEIELSPIAAGRKPDILVHSVPPVYVEITALQTPEEWKCGERTLQSLAIFTILDPEVAVGGTIHQILSDELIAEYQKQSREAIQVAKDTGQAVEIHVPDVIDLYFAPSANTELVASWKAERKVHHLVGPPLDSALVFRVTRALGHKVAQLPTGSPGIVVVYDNLARLQEPAEVIARFVQDVMSHYGQVSAAVLVTRTFDLGTQETTADLHAFGLELSQTIGHLLREGTLVMKNPSTTYPLDDAFLHKLFSAFWAPQD